MTGFGDDPFGSGGFGYADTLSAGRVTYTLRKREPTLTPGVVLSDWSAKLIERDNLPDTLQVSGWTQHLRELMAPGVGVTLEDDTGVRFTGPMTEFEKSGDGTCTATFASDLLWLWGRICYPSPTVGWESQTADYDTRTGAAETVLLGFINANAGPGALAARRVTSLTLPTTLGRGGTVTVTARFDNLGQLVRDLAEPAGLRVTIKQDGTSLVLGLEPRADLSAWARYGTVAEGGPGVLSPDWSMRIAAPRLTWAIVAGGGEGAARVLRERSSTTVESSWSLRSEALVDQRNTSVLGELDKAGNDALAEAATPVEISATIPDVEGMHLGVDVPIGSLVGLDLDGSFITDRLRQVTTDITPTGDVKSGVVGSPEAGLTRDQKQFLNLSKSIRKVQAR